jgi:opacity protein-like surface antigen
VQVKDLYFIGDVVSSWRARFVAVLSAPCNPPISLRFLLLSQRQLFQFLVFGDLQDTTQLRNLKGTMLKIRFATAFVAPLFVFAVFVSLSLLSGSSAFAQSTPAQETAAQSAPAQETPAQSSPTENPPVPPAPAPKPIEFPKVQVFGGYSLFHEGKGNLNATDFDVDLHIYPRTLVPQTNFTGGNAEAQYNFGAWVGGVVDVSGYSGMPFTTPVGLSGAPSLTSYSILAGPVVTYRKWRRVTPYVHALFGWNHVNLGAGTLSETTAIGSPTAVSSAGESSSDFAMAFGGGADYKVTRHVAIRFGQLDWFHTSLNFNSFYGTAFNSTLVQGFETKERNLRFSAGIVVRF